MLMCWDVAPCSLVEIDRLFKGAYCLHLQGRSSKYSVSASKENTTRLHYKDELVNAVQGNNFFCVCENHTKHMNTLCGQNSVLQTVKADGTPSYHWTSKG
jgi:hypothetical protein